MTFVVYGALSVKLFVFFKFRMKDSTGWYLCWSSSYLDIPVERIAINAKVMSANQDNTNKMVAASAGSLVRLWSIADAGESREIGNDCSKK